MLSAPCQQLASARRWTSLRAQRPLIAAPCARRSTVVRAAQDPSSGASSSSSASSSTLISRLSDVAPLSLVALQLASAAHAEEDNFLDAAPTSPQDYLIFFAPILLYGVFYVYREKVNPRARLIDFVTLAAGAAIVANIASIGFFRTRLF